MQRFASAAFVTVALCFVAASPASAQGPTYSWTGFYIGAHVGTGFNTPDFEVDEHGPSTYNTMLFIDGPISNGITFGGQAGYNRLVWQKVMVGGEFAIGRAGYSGIVANGPGDDTEQETRGGMYWTVLGRVGYAVNDRVLPYFTLGYLGASNSVSVLDDCTTSPCGPLMVNTTASGSGRSFAWGVGVDYALNMKAMNKAWLVKVEWLNSDFRTNVTASDSANHSWHFNTHFPKGLIRGAIIVHWGN